MRPLNRAAGSGCVGTYVNVCRSHSIIAWVMYVQRIGVWLAAKYTYEYAAVIAAMMRRYDNVPHAPWETLPAHSASTLFFTMGICS